MKRFSSLLTAIIATNLLISGCDSDQPQPPIAGTEPYANDAITPENEYWARENFDLERVGNLLAESESPEEFERYLNDDDGINNLDLNGDGYADYISVDEFEDRDSNSRGLSLFTRFGPDVIQEIATIFFYRDRPDYPGSRVLLTGNDLLYGDNYYYETNWLDRALPLVSYLFTDRDQYYSSPYYYDNYPPDYAAYEVVDTPYYVSRIEQLYPEPVFVYTTSAPEYYTNVKIKSPHKDKWMEKVHAKLAKPRKEQAEFFKSVPARKNLAKGEKRNGPPQFDAKPGRPDPPRSDRGDERGNPGRDDRGAPRGNPDKPNQGGPPSVKPGKPDNPGAKAQGNPKVDGPGKGGGPGKGPGGGPGKAPGGGPGKGGGQGKGGGKGKP